MSENQRTVCDWADKTFGYCKSINVALDRVLKEIDELTEIKDYENNFNKLSDECADILITLYRLADVIGFQLEQAVDHKMEINRGRKWKIAEDGTGQHIKE